MLSSANKTRILDKRGPLSIQHSRSEKVSRTTGRNPGGKRSCYLPGDILRAMRTIIRAAGRCVNLLGLQGCTPEEWWEVKGRLFLSFPTAHNAVGYLHEDSY